MDQVMDKLHDSSLNKLYNSFSPASRARFCLPCRSQLWMPYTTIQPEQHWYLHFLCWR